MLRRDVLAGLAALAASPGGAAGLDMPGLQLGKSVPFDPEMVADLARRLRRRPYRAPRRVPEAWTNLSYDQYTSTWFDTRKALWANDMDTPLRLDVFAPGLYFPSPVDISVVENGMASPLAFDLGVFAKTDKFPDLPVDETLGYSGLRLRAELKTQGIYEEFAVFQGASYFRAIGTGNTYGTSARGLAIDTAEPSGEEFPEFRAFWLEKPVYGQKSFVVHALLDSPSCTGAYSFKVTPGQPLTMEVAAQIFPRTDLENVGIAPLTSMFQYDQTNRHRFNDFRPAVHDADGLLITNGAGETLWRPLANPKTLQVSAFVDNGCKGFGLMQRARKYSDFADLEALYHRRPGVWVEPIDDWGAGAVTLVEIPTPSEIYDNIVCYWRPEGGLAGGSELSVAYRLSWGGGSDYGGGIPVLNTMIGSAFENNGTIVLIDFGNSDAVPLDLSEVEIVVQSSAGEVSGGVLQRNPETGGPRLAFKFHEGDATTIEFRAQLRLAGAPLSEVWLYRWTA